MRGTQRQACAKQRMMRTRARGAVNGTGACSGTNHVCADARVSGMATYSVRKPPSSHGTPYVTSCGKGRKPARQAAGKSSIECAEVPNRVARNQCCMLVVPSTTSLLGNMVGEQWLLVNAISIKHGDEMLPPPLCSNA